MEKRLGFIIGFVAGMAGFLFLFKVIILDRTAPSDELAPGMVLILSVLSGIIFGFIGKRVQYILNKRGQRVAS
ncbi:MAG TPA: hypothetical protein VJ844_12215 [Mucilaginibacter sp.]|nr:hypothetical protein [Mucilaginibacter sp.]